MSCRHDLALGNCRICYPGTGAIEPQRPNHSTLEGPGALPAPRNALAKHLAEWADFDLVQLRLAQSLDLLPEGSWVDVVLHQSRKHLLVSQPRGRATDRAGAQARRNRCSGARQGQ